MWANTESQHRDSVYESSQQHFSQVVSSPCHAVSLAWAKGLKAQWYNCSSPRLPGWPMHLGVPLPPWNSKDNKCCLHETPYPTASLRVLGDVIAKATPYKQIPLDAPTSTKHFPWFTSDAFLKRLLSCLRENPMWNYYKEIYEQKWYQKGLLIAIEEVCNKYLEASCQGFSTLSRGIMSMTLKNP